MMIRLLLVLLVLVPALSACGGDDKDSDKTTITISGAFALYPLVVQWTEEYQKLHSDVRFDVSAGGAGKGMSDVLAGAVDVAMVSREVREEEAGKGALPFAVAKDAVVGTISADNPALEQILATGITPEMGAKIWLTGEVKTWGELLGTDDTSEIHVYTRADAAGAAEVWAIYMGGKAQEDLKGTAVQGDPGLAEAVRSDALGIGYNNIGFAYDLSSGQPVDGLRVIPIDLNGDGEISDDENFYADKDSITAAIVAGLYPSPPARALFLVTKGQPNEAVSDFLRWTLTDGQQYISAAGYVQLPEEVLQASLAAVGEKQP
ncbi:MAG: substrate-binding domain-containing protein [Chloroflexi bacterium]|nr:substrate-binding domain-containing protein [Chloroflexota bacterium]